MAHCATSGSFEIFDHECSGQIKTCVRVYLMTPTLDRLLRYEAVLDRSFDRTLNQLERMQRVRLGQPVLPKLEVRHSLS